MPTVSPVAPLRKTLGAAAAALACALELLTPAKAAVDTRKSQAFERFRFSFFEDPDSARQGLDTRSLSQLEGEERLLAENMLIQFLPDSRAIIGLGALRSRRAEPMLTRLFENELLARQSARRNGDVYWLPHNLVWSAQALWGIHPDPRWRDAILDVLATADMWEQRMTAAEALFDMRDDVIAQALDKALDDPNGLVRHHAARALFAMHGLPLDSKDPQHMLYRVMSRDSARREDGKRAILAAIAGRPILAP